LRGNGDYRAKRYDNFYRARKEDFMDTRNNFFIFNDDCHRHCRHCCQSCWVKDDFYNQNDWNNECACHQNKEHCRPDPVCPKPKPPRPTPERVCDCKGIGIQAVLQNSEAPIIEAGENIKFDTILHRINHGITYDINVGEFMIKRPGDYRINWQIIIDGTHTKRFVNFGIKLNGKPYHVFPLPVTTGLLTSELILTTKNPNSVIALFNNTEDQVRLSRHTPNANLVITNM